MLNTLAPTKDDLYEHPEGNPVLTYRYAAFVNNAYWTAIYMAYRLHKHNPYAAGEIAWDWYYDETDGFFRIMCRPDQYPPYPEHCSCDCGCDNTEEWHSELRCACRDLNCFCIEIEEDQELLNAVIGEDIVKYS